MLVPMAAKASRPRELVQQLPVSRCCSCGFIVVVVIHDFVDVNLVDTVPTVPIIQRQVQVLLPPRPVVTPNNRVIWFHFCRLDDEDEHDDVCLALAADSEVPNEGRSSV